MANKQTRRSVSVRGETYERLKLWCEMNDRSMSGVVEDLLAQYLKTEAQHQRPTERVGNVHFTF
jgi:hypothetical protein